MGHFQDDRHHSFFPGICETYHQFNLIWLAMNEQKLFTNNITLKYLINLGLCDSLLPGLYWKWFLSNAIHRAHPSHILNKPGTSLTLIYFNNNKQSNLAKGPIKSNHRWTVWSNRSSTWGSTRSWEKLWSKRSFVVETKTQTMPTPIQLQKSRPWQSWPR